MRFKLFLKISKQGEQIWDGKKSKLSKFVKRQVFELGASVRELSLSWGKDVAPC